MERTPDTANETPATSAAPTAAATPTAPAPEAWQLLLEEEDDCCRGCQHKPR